MMTPDDTTVLRALAGATFPPDAQVILPSGMLIDGREASVYTAAYMPEDGLPDRRVPEHLADMPVHYALGGIANIYAENDRLRVQVKAEQRYGRQMWHVACLFAGAATVAVGLLVWSLLTRA